jgi:hypothetical protein
VCGLLAAVAFVTLGLTLHFSGASVEKVRELSSEAGFPPVMVEAMLARHGWMGGLQAAAAAAEAAKPKPAPRPAPAPRPVVKAIAPPPPKPEEPPITAEMLDDLPLEDAGEATTAS